MNKNNPQTIKERKEVLYLRESLNKYLDNKELAAETVINAYNVIRKYGKNFFDEVATAAMCDYWTPLYQTLKKEIEEIQIPEDED